ncbi:MAG: methylenetetrahydrofolate--tRNA-(uracil(54)-C(5))-methyltransferase (FADH(2)-oxidizing) TrmFO [Chloroflexi bacterium]|nr:methylenetetrahydrofolate--tRNA-(uracil(54)-C(5))-methyltransferase (FADH(2)-oxidizing) TrmFO [Chloroflexota bacterium]MCL5275204.1 methylenetetrahydrofolate--tRNA-(uracil(54)-C(5))-methyltransferase (FADH(2)-oxidizing) TrmFO [Chloroflexota bacterium]
MNEITVVGGGLAGTEAAWQAAQRGVPVRLYEMRPRKMTPAHTTGKLAELVCSNSLGSDQVDRAPGLLKHELRTLGSMIMECAAAASVPAGGALAVDRDIFASLVSAKIEGHPNIEVVHEEVTHIPAGVTVIASGPLTSDALAAEIAALTGAGHLYFWDAIAPIVSLESIDFNIAFRASRYGKHGDGTVTAPGENPGEGDYINCPMSRDEYYAFIDALVSAEMATLRDFEINTGQFFEGCLPVEVMARRGRDSLAFGPMRPVGIKDPRTGRRPYAVVQLRQDNVAGSLYNIVGFQTNLKYPEQDRVLRMIPGLGHAEFVRHGHMHRNTFINSPLLLDASLRYAPKARAGAVNTVTHDSLFFAGQIVGVEGYVGNAATGLVAGINAAALVSGQPLVELPGTTMLGALCHYISHAEPRLFQPMKANFGILPALDNPPRDKRARSTLYAQRAQRDLEAYRASSPSLSIQAAAAVDLQAPV